MSLITDRLPEGSLIYLAGPMTDIPQHNKPAFKEARLFLKGAGYRVIDPFDICEHNGYTPTEDGSIKLEDLNVLMLEDYFAIAGADGVAMLPNWRASRGSKKEFIFAQSIGTPIWDLEQQRFVDHWQASVVIFTDDQVD